MKKINNNITLKRGANLVLAMILCFLLLGCQRKENFYSGETNYEYDDQTFFHTAHT